MNLSNHHIRIDYFLFFLFFIKFNRTIQKSMILKEDSIVSKKNYIRTSNDFYVGECILLKFLVESFDSSLDPLSISRIFLSQWTVFNWSEYFNSFG